MSKIILIGPPGVGKTCLSYRYFFDKFPDQETQPTYVAYCTIVKDAILYDTAGQERYAPICAALVTTMDAVVIVTDADRLLDVGVYVSLCESRGKSYIIALNKSDTLDVNECIEYERALLNEFEADAVVIVSALTGDGMDVLMDAALALAERERQRVVVKSLDIASNDGLKDLKEDGCC